MNPDFGLRMIPDRKKTASNEKPSEAGNAEGT